MIISIAHTDVTTRMKRVYNPMYQYNYSYTRLVNINNYSVEYLEIKKEHKKVVGLLNNANKTIESLEYKIEMLEKDVAYWKKRATTKTSPSDKIKREEAIKKMRLDWKSGKK